MAESRVADARVRGWIVTPIVALACFLVPTPAWVVEMFYSRDFYPWLQDWMTALTNAVPLAAIDILLPVAACVVAIRVVRTWGLARREGAGRAMADLGRRALRGVAVIAIVFLGTWGCNYRRTPLEASLAGHAAAPLTVDSLRTAIGDSNALAAKLRVAVVADAPLGYDEIAARLEAPMQTALLQLSQAPLARPGHPKTSYVLWPFFDWAGVTGMVDPLALESLVQPDLLPAERPFTLAHEWAHLAGRADEAEASAVGWLACMNGGAPLAYSASLYLIMEAASALPPEARARALAHLDPGVRSDIEDISRRVTRVEKPRVRRAAFKIYDDYLKANQVPDGTASYDRALSLILSDPLRGTLTGYRPKAS